MLFRIVIVAFNILSYIPTLTIMYISNKINIIYFILFTLIFIFTTMLCIKTEVDLHKINGRLILISIIGTILGYCIGVIFSSIIIDNINLTFRLEYLFNIPLKELEIISKMFKNLILFLCSYAGFTIFYLKENEIYLESGLNYSLKTHDPDYYKSKKILDTSVIIDGRISDIIEKGFIDGDIIIPKFVLIELQQVADSADSIKRARGRRGLEILNKMKTSKKIIIKIVDKDFTETSEVDSKLILLAKSYKDASIVTIDFNLNRVSKIQGVKILNLNDLVNCIKTNVKTNQEITMQILKEGKDKNQGISYLDDGTMVVIENGRNYIGKEVKVFITSVLQTSSGRMIFSKISNDK